VFRAVIGGMKTNGRILVVKPIAIGYRFKCRKTLMKYIDVPIEHFYGSAEDTRFTEILKLYISSRVPSS